MKPDDLEVAADLVEENGFPDVADFLRREARPVILAKKYAKPITITEALLEASDLKSICDRFKAMHRDYLQIGWNGGDRENVDSQT